MDKSTLTQTTLAQIPEEFRPNKHEHRSPWALISIFIIVIVFGAFFIFRKNRIVTTLSVVPTPSSTPTTKTPPALSELEASVGAITIPDYTESL